MIEQELIILMRCDGCGGELIDDYGHTIILNEDISSYMQLRKMAIDRGWKCEKSCLCPVCRKENQTNED